ncbi:microfibrillar-associated protein 2-like [Huso huso]|uniref:Microfibrillar-associated protein 2-like n=2 Tax=Acipenseridae TaxID=7900 RepID=A0ABR0YY00_HUSHU
MRTTCLFLLSLPALLLAQQYDVGEEDFYPSPSQYGPYIPLVQPYSTLRSNRPTEQSQTELETQQSQLTPQEQQHTFPIVDDLPETEPTEPGPLDCREEQYPCTRLYSVHKPCQQCLKSLCFYSLRRVYVVNKEVCVRTVCAHDELLRADLCRDQYSKCGVMAHTGLCGTMGTSCAKSCGGC